ncbi:hypothetical protein J2W24_001425 [Variovorax boronicumulans]|uniref:DUF3540 domain-containing protein n=1 Tax=Variovorax boronicumulans TaxID=436515 RepID=UPI00277E37CF|nr:DUF3540 domain-containing protein [Variovorax boronicumulans]MDP9915789.1 hypothetical protein [Variovorax boronicumulans]
MNQRALREPASPPSVTSETEMHALLRKPLPAQAAPVWTGSALGTVVQTLPDGRFVVEPQPGGAPWHCPRAASCLLQPAVGDVVLVAGPQRDQLFLIAVVTQADPSQSQLVAEGDLTIRSRRGGIAMQASAFALQADKATVDITDMAYRGAEVRVTTLVARYVGRTLETVLDRLSLLTRSSFRLTEEVEQVRAGQIDMQAAQSLRLHAKNTFVTSQALVKVDAEQIHMG